MEHPSQTLLYLYNDGLTPTNAVGAFRWNALGSPAFERMVFETLREFGVSVYALEDGPKNGNYAPSFHIIDHVSRDWLWRQPRPLVQHSLPASLKNRAPKERVRP